MSAAAHPPDPRRSRGDLEIAVAYHDRRPHPAQDDAPFTAVCNVTPSGERSEGFGHYDDEGGFPDRNVMYGELSALRWLQANSDAAIVGLAHYRRIWTARRHPRTFAPGIYDLRTWDWADLPRQRAETGDLLSAMRGADWCSAAPYDVRWAGHANLVEQFEAHHSAAMLDALAEAVTEVTPQWPHLGDYLTRSRRLRPFNMVLARRAALDDYLQWLWPVLDATVKRLGVMTDPYQNRYPGFLAERLHGYWLDCSPAARQLQIGQVGVAIVPADAITNSASAGGLHGVPVDRRPVAATDLVSTAARYLPFRVRASAMQVMRGARRGAPN